MPPPYLTDVAFSPTDDVLALITGEGLDLRVLPSLARLASWPAASPGWRKLRFSPDGSRLVVTRFGGPMALVDMAHVARAVREQKAVLPLPEVITRFGNEHARGLASYRGIAFDAGGDLWAEGPATLERWRLQGKPSVIERIPCWRRAEWDAALCPRHRRTLYGHNDVGPEWHSWDDGRTEQFHDWCDPHFLHGASAFCVAANAAETCFALGGKHRYVNLVFADDAFRPQRTAQLDYGSRVVVCALHPHRPLLAAKGLGNPLRLFNTETGERLADAGTDYTTGYPYR